MSTLMRSAHIHFLQLSTQAAAVWSQIRVNNILHSQKIICIRRKRFASAQNDLHPQKKICIHRKRFASVKKVLVKKICTIQHFFTDAKLFLPMQIFLCGCKSFCAEANLFLQNIIDPNLTPYGRSLD